MYKIRNKIKSKFVEKLLTYRKMLKDIFTFLGLCHRDDSFITLYIVVLKISILKSDQSEKFVGQKS